MARLAGVPDWVNRRAEAILERLEGKNEVDENRQVMRSETADGGGGGIQMTLFGVQDHPLLEKIKKLDPNQLTPLHALEMVNQWQTELSTKDDS